MGEIERSSKGRETPQGTNGAEQFPPSFRILLGLIEVDSGLNGSEGRLSLRGPLAHGDDRECG